MDTEESILYVRCSETYKEIKQYPTVTKNDNINRKLISYYIGFLLIGCVGVEGCHWANGRRKQIV